MMQKKTGLMKGGTFAAYTPPVEEEKQEEPSLQEEDIAPLVEDIPDRDEAREEAPPIVEEQIAEPPPPPPPPPPQLDKIIIEEAEKKAEEIIKKARAEAKKLIEETKLYSQSAFSQAERDGFVKGKEDGFEAGREEMSNHIKEAKNVLEQATKERDLLIRTIEPEMAKLAIRIAEKIIQTQVELNQDIVINMIRASLDKVKQREEVIIKVNSADLDYVRDRKDIFARMIEGLKMMDIIVDPGVERGGCIIETNLGNVDARIGVQIHTLELAFEKAEKGGDEPGES
jgi:flagellar assembly protein FliH